jgi:hypothetical protein
MESEIIGPAYNVEKRQVLSRMEELDLTATTEESLVPPSTSQVGGGYKSFFGLFRTFSDFFVRNSGEKSGILIL